jgi:TonB family protein
MRTGFALFLSFGFVLAVSAFTVSAAEKKDKRRAVMIYKPRIEYPYEARRAGITGSGVVAVDVDYATGKVKRAYMLKSTGSSILDDAAMSSFREAKFLPGTFESPIKIPISYTGGKRLRTR